MNIRKTIFSLTLISLYCLAPLRVAWAVEQDVIVKANEVVMAIYNDILENKQEYRELADFDERALSTNPYGIYEILYKHDINNGVGSQLISEIAVSIVPLADVKYANQGNKVVNLGFPLLNVKISAYQEKPFRHKSYDILKPLQKYGKHLWHYQQQFIPLKLTLKTDKDVYQIREKVEFTVTLTNTAHNSMVVKDLNDSSLFFLYDEKPLGIQDGSSNSSKSKKVVLKSGESLSKTFSVSGFSQAKVFDIFASYSQTIKGIQPTAAATIEVVNQPEDNNPLKRRF